MKTKIKSVFPVIISFVYILSVLLFIFSLAVEYRNGSISSKDRFNKITKDLSRISRNYEPQSKKFYDEFLSSLGNISDIAGLQIKYGEDLIFSYPNNSSDFEKINTSLASTFQTAVFSENGLPISLTASIYLLRPVSIFYKGRIAFSVVLLATIVTAFYLAFYSQDGSLQEEEDENEENGIEYPEIEDYEDFPREEDTSETSSSLTLKNEKEDEKEEEDVLAFLNTDENDVEEEPSGLFCPETGFGWEEYMMTRLDSELVRSASSDQDLALILVKVVGIEWKSVCGKEIAKRILDIAKFNDLVFNYQNDGVSIIFQNQNTDKALVTAEELLKKIQDAVSSYGENFQVLIGLSTRSLRLISGTRLFNESVEALKRADADSPIIAFRVNPERYKNFLASESFKEDPS